MTCPNCGAPSTPNARHCSTCGALLAGAINRPISGATPSVYAPSTATPTPSARGSDRELQPGTVLNGRYRIQHVLGSGSCCRVYRAVDISDASNLQIAIKELLDSPFTSPQDKQEAITWFKREVGVSLALDHPGIPAIHSYWTAHRTAGPFYLAMDYVPGKTLEDTLRDAGGRIHWRSVADWGIALCDVLSYLHSRMPPFVFRDLKLPNVMLDTHTGLPVLIDFGITRQMAASGGTAIGTWGYVPYEQILGKAEPRSDLYALGATLHALLTGRQPDVEYTRLQRSGLDVERTMRALFPPADTLAPDVPLALAQIVTKATSFDVADRFPDAATMGSALRQVLGYTPHGIQAGRPTAVANPPRPAVSTPTIPPTVTVNPPVPPSNPVILTPATPIAVY